MDLPKLFATLNWPLVLFIAFAFVSFIQVFYYLFFFMRLAFYNEKEKQVSQTHAVSVIVCARDEAENLTNNLPGILVQDYKTTHEVIVVNDNSYDESKYLLEALQKEFRQLKIVELTQEAKMIPGKKFPLSIGIKSASHEILLLTDADCVPASEHWIDKMQNSYDENTEIILGYGAYHKKKGLLNKFIRWETYFSALQYMSYSLAGLPYMGVGRNLSYKKNVFFRQKGFSAHNKLAGGDDDLFINGASTSKNTKINIDKDTFTLSKPPLTWTQWRKQKARHYTTSKHYKLTHKFLLALFALTQFLFYPLLIITAVFYSWKLALAIGGLRLLLQLFIYTKTLKSFGEKDLIPLFLFMDIWMFFYYLIFAPALFKKPKPVWK
jgi:glycosyltransferase involved in cell wall biosynthesis